MRDVTHTVVTSVLSALVLGLVAGGFQLYLDVHDLKVAMGELKSRFDYVNGRGWRPPPSARE